MRAEENTVRPGTLRGHALIDGVLRADHGGPASTTRYDDPGGWEAAT